MKVSFNEVKIEIYVPEEFVKALRNGLNEVGACKIGDYDNCASITEVLGYWRPLDGAKPYDGFIEEISEGRECKMEVRCKIEYVKDAIKVIKKIHPYEEPVYNVVPLLNNLFE